MTDLTIKTDRLALRMADESDISSIIAYFQKNRAHFAPTDPAMPEGFYTEPFWRERVEKSRLEFQSESSLRLFLFPGESKQVIGTVNFTQMFRGPFQACYVGYGIDLEHQGRGLMYEALVAAIQFVFRDLNFHRIMANHLSENERSAHLLKRLGFTVEGLARNYLLINGAWRDHVLNSLHNPDWKPR